MWQLIRNLIYRKTVLWLDLGVEHSEYEDKDVVDAVEYAVEKKSKFGYFPSRMEF